jgi:subtilisin family serine protease
MFEQGSSGKHRPDKYVPGEILVKVKKNSAAALRFGASSQAAHQDAGLSDATPSSFEQLLRRHHINRIRPAFGRASSGASTRGSAKPGREAESAKPFRRAAERSDLSRWYRLELPADANEQELLELLKLDSEVEAAELNGQWRLAVLPDAGTDPGYADQWHLIDMSVPDAWQYLHNDGIHPGGARDVVVAVVDSGVDYTHEDLIGNMWTNGGEIPNNGTDDDGNGFVDDIHGCSVVADGRSAPGDPVDLSGHGTHVAGIVATTAYNSRGGVGVAFNVQIMAIRSAQHNGLLAFNDIAEGIIYAVDNGADIINMSFAGPYRSQIVEDALSVAFSQCVLIAAAGNSGAPTEEEDNSLASPYYPAALPWVVGVMASDQDDKLALFTSYDSAPRTGIEYEVAAPGTEIYSTLPGDKYAKWDGTSMSAPVVSGIAALLRSYYSDPGVYSNRFIMGQIAGTTRGPQGGGPGDPAPVVDANAALTDSPIPEVTMLESWIFDDKAIDANNDGDGRVDAGERVYLAVELINRWGMANDLTVTLEARAIGSPDPDPYVTVEVNSVDYDAIGPFNTADNGVVYDQESVIIGVDDPFVFTVDSNCDNGHEIPFLLTISYHNAWDPNDPNLYTYEQGFEYVVQRGRLVPTVISEDMELTSDGNQ